MPGDHIADPDEVGEAIQIDGIHEAAIRIRKFVKPLIDSVEREGEFTVTVAQMASVGQVKPIYEGIYSHEEGADAFVTELIDAAVEDIIGLETGRMRYVCTAKNLSGRATFTLKAKGHEMDDIDDFEDLPGRAGVLGMLMRHQNAFFKQVNQKDKRIGDLTMRIIDDKDARIRSLEEREVTVMKSYEDLLNGRHIRDMEISRMQSSERRMDQVAGTLMNALPIVAGKFLGGAKGAAEMAASPGGRTALEMQLEGLIGSLKTEQLQAITTSGIFSPDQLANLITMIEAVIARREQENTAREEQNQPPAQAGGKAAAP